MTKPSAFHQAQVAIWKAQMEARKLELEQRWADFLRCPLVDHYGPDQKIIGWCSDADRLAQEISQMEKKNEELMRRMRGC